MIRGIIFDLDDTLYEEYDFIMSGFKSISEYLSNKHHIKADEIFKMLKNDFDKGLRGKNFDVLLKKLKLSPENVENLVEQYRNHIPTISLSPDAKIILPKLKDSFKLGLITDGYPTTQKNKIKALNIGEIFDCVTINNINKGINKLNEKPLKDTLLKLKLNQNDTICIGDNPLKDFLIAKKLNIHTIKIKRDSGIYCKKIVNEQFEAEHTITNLLEIIPIIDSINNDYKII